MLVWEIAPGSVSESAAAAASAPGTNLKSLPQVQVIIEKIYGWPSWM
jgi:hypothetical protein